MTDDEIDDNEWLLVGEDDREFAFTGRRLGHGSSHRSGRDRWTEVCVYLTVGGAYIVHIVGCSIVPGEAVRGRVRVCETAAAAVEALHQIDDDGIKYLTNTARAAATEAAARDADFREAFMVQRVA